MKYYNTVIVSNRCFKIRVRYWAKRDVFYEALFIQEICANYQSESKSILGKISRGKESTQGS
jgi:hypothetical protein